MTKGILKCIFACLAISLCTPFAMAQDDADADKPAETSTEAAPESEPAAEAPAAPDTGDVAWMLTSSALVLMMTAPGLALFYCGLVRKKNVLGVMMQCVFLMGLMTVVWAIVGYSWAFAGSSPYYGSFEKVMLNGVIPSASAGGVDAVATEQIFMVFQGMFFIITPALICGAFAERMKFSTMCVFQILWGLIVYCPIAHWVWSDNGWLLKYGEFGALDFAGGTVVHISSGVSALVCSIVIGKRLGFGTEAMPPHNLTYTCIGAALLWVGWFGFNAGSALASNGSAVNAFVATHMAAAAGVIGWSIAEWFKHGKPSILGACSGAVAGLVCITPASGSVTAVSGLILGLIAGLVCYFGCTGLKNKFGYDDSLDAFGVHGLGGTVGALLTGVFATKYVVGGDKPVGLLEGNAGQMVPQIVSIVAAAGLAVVGTLIILKVLDAVMGLRVTEEEELQGLDLSQHGEEGYIFQ